MSWMDVELAGRKVRVAIVRSGAGAWVSWNGQAVYVGPERTEAVASALAEREIRAPMTGRVVKVAALPGAAVKANEILVVLEAMKMEYRLVSPREGKIESVGCREGDRVDLGRVLVTLAP